MVDYHSTVSELCTRWHQLLAYLSALTLGEIWVKVYNPPTPRNLALAAVIISFYLPSYYRRFVEWRASRKVVSFSWPLPKQAEQGWTGRVIEDPALDSHLRDETLLPPEAGKTGAKRQYLTCYDPSTAYHLETFPLLSADEVAEEIVRADVASKKWKHSTFATRLSLMRSLKAWVMRDMDEIVRVACRDTGKTRVDAVFGEILVTLAKIDWIIKHGEAALAPSQRAGNLLLSHKVSKVHYEPLGVTLALVSWNYSFHNLISPILASLFAGNAVVVKCSEQVAWSSMWFVGGIRACLKALELDEDVVQLVVCLPDVAETVTRNPLVKHITFIGSEPVGRKVAIAAAEIMVPTCIELGGKDPAFLLPDANIDTWTSHLMRGVFQSAGQNCIGIELILVHRSKYQQLIDAVLPKIKALRVGTDVGSLISSTPIPKLESIIAHSQAQGARVLAGGKRYNHPERPHAAYFEPTLVVDVALDMEIARNELFAPVMTIVPYDDVDTVLEQLKRSRFGLGGGVYGDDRAQCRRVAAELECGMVAINDFGVFYLNQAAPFGGVKASGHGRFAGEEGLRSLCNPKTITEDRVFSYIRTGIPPAVDFPLPSPSTYWGFLHGLVGLAHGGPWVKAKGLSELIVAALKGKA